jgi:hypothetical protein
VKTTPRVGRDAGDMATTRYRIVVRGRLSRAFSSVFEGISVERLPGATALEADIADQAQLYGMLERLRNLGIELVSVNALG